MANGRCRLHGGASLSGVAHPGYKGAGRSRFVPARWQQAYGEALEDPDLLSLRADLARTDAQIDDLQKLLPTSEEELESFQSFLSHFDAGMDAMRRSKSLKRKGELRAAEGAYDDFILAMETAEMLRGEVTAYRLTVMEVEARLAVLTGLRAKLTDSETKRLTAATKSLGVETVRSIIWAMLDILRREVADRTTLQRIQDRFRETFHAFSGRPL